MSLFWECRVCTYDGTHESLRFCDMCKTERPASERQPMKAKPDQLKGPPELMIAGNARRIAPVDSRKKKAKRMPLGDAGNKLPVQKKLMFPQMLPPAKKLPPAVSKEQANKLDNVAGRSGVEFKQVIIKATMSPTKGKKTQNTGPQKRKQNLNY